MTLAVRFLFFTVAQIKYEQKIIAIYSAKFNRPVMVIDCNIFLFLRLSVALPPIDF